MKYFPSRGGGLHDLAAKYEHARLSLEAVTKSAEASGAAIEAVRNAAGRLITHLEAVEIARRLFLGGGELANISGVQLFINPLCVVRTLVSVDHIIFVGGYLHIKKNYIDKPALYSIGGNKILAHPAIYEQIKQALK